MIKVGDKLRLKEWHSGDYVEVLGLGDYGFIGRRHFSDEAVDFYGSYERRWLVYTPPVKRYVVELRPPKKGEQYAVITAEHDYETARFVIVEELS